MRALRRLVGIMLLPPALFLGCGPGTAGEATGSCETRSVNGVCEDYAGPADVVAAYKSACTSGTWKDSACDRTGSVGGCEDVSSGMGLTITNWFYAPMTADTVQQSCQAPSTFDRP
jgi:hypothetical protein